MLYLYQSNRLETLAKFFTTMVNVLPLSSLFQPEVVIIQSRGMGRWLSLNLATQAGVAANMDFVLPAAYMWRLMQRVTPGLPSTSSFAPDVLIWRVMALLPLLNEPVFALLSRYQQRGELARFELAVKIADIFDQYLVFRPDWIRRWERGELLGLGKDEAWQAALWQRLTDTDLSYHRVRLLDEFLPALTALHLPERVSVFGIASLAPVYLALIKHMAKLTDVCLFLLNPCEGYWGVLDDRVDLFGQAAAPDSGHPLLASLGRQGRDFFDQILEVAPQSHDLFEFPEGQGLLARLQRDILTFTSPDTLALWPDDSDRSIEVHVVHSPMRELEVLKDVLLGYLQEDSTLTPADIAVLTPDVTAYAPYIDAVFGTVSDASNRLPYSMADRTIETEEPLLTAFIALLELLDSRFTADQVMALLDCPALRARFALQAHETVLLRQWIQHSGIRWGIDAEHKALLGLPPEPMYTWRWGLDRLLLGVVLPEAAAGQGSPLFAGLLPASGAEGSLAMSLARFCQFFQQLQSFAIAWRKPTNVVTWRDRLHEAIEGMFAPFPSDELAFHTLCEALDALVNQADLAGFQQDLSLLIVRDWFKNQRLITSSSGFLTGGVTFCAMVPMRAIPFRILCVVGMNDGVYPRNDRPISFDLIASHPRCGDRSRRIDDRYLFLEAILSARDKLYLSYVGLSVRTGETVPPSALITELMDVIARMSGATSALQRLDLEKQLMIRHPLQPFSASYFDARNPRLASFATQYAQALSQPATDLRPFASEIPYSVTTNTMRFNDFIRFWQLPCRAWLADRLGVRIRHDMQNVLVREPFSVDRDTRQRVRKQLLDTLLTRRSLVPVQDRIISAGGLPSGPLGQVCLQQEMACSRRLASALPASVQAADHLPVPFKVALGHLVLVGELTAVKTSGRLAVLHRRAYATELIAMWLNHLMLCVVAPNTMQHESVLFAENEWYCWSPVPDAASVLEEWVAYWLKGQHIPLPFFPRTSLAYARMFYTSQSIERSYIKAQTEWSPTFDGRAAQQDDPAIELAFRHQHPLEDPMFHDMATSLLSPLLDYHSVVEKP